MVYIYGGAFKAGYADSYSYGPDFIIEEDVVLVTFNYRVGAFGKTAKHNTPGFQCFSCKIEVMLFSKIIKHFFFFKLAQPI